MDSVFIDDGMNREFKIPAVSGLHGALSGTFRPVIFEARRQLAALIDDPKGYTEKMGSLLARHLLTWDARKGEGTAEINAGNICRLHPELLVKLLDVVLGYSPAAQADDEKN